MLKLTKKLSLVYLFSFVSLIVSFSSAGVPAEGSTPPRKVRAVGFGISPAIRDLPAPEQSKPEAPDPEAKPKPNKIVRHVVEGIPGDRDGALQKEMRLPDGRFALNTPTPSVSFEGLSIVETITLGQGFLPPDTVGDVGPNHYVQMVNSAYRVFDKTGTPLTPVRSLADIWAALGPSNPCSTSEDGDPIVLYDPLADRWLLSQFCTIANPNNHQLIAISQTPDPTGAYYLYDFMMPNNKFNDYPKFGVWPDGYYMSDNQFNQAGTAFLGAGVFAFDRAKMLVGDPTASYIYFDVENGNPNIGGLLPSDLDGITAPPLGTPNYFVYFTATEFGDPADALRVFEFHADFVTPANSTFTERAESPVAVAAFDPRTPPGRDNIEQPPPANNATAALDAISDRLMFRLAYRNFGTHESLIANHTVNVGTGTTLALHQAGVRYYELRRTLPGGSWAVNEQASFAPDTDNRWMASAAMDNGGNLAVGYSISSTTVFPGIRWAGRLATDPANGLAQGEALVIAGGHIQAHTSSRWGDYSAMSVDPSDDCTFWYTQEYYATDVPANTAEWQTRIAAFKFPSCVAAPVSTIQGTVTDVVTGLPIQNAIVQTNGGVLRATDASGNYSMTVAPGTHDVTASKQFYNSLTASNVVVASGGTATVNFALAPLPNMEAAGSTLDAEACLAPNGDIDPGETVTVTLSVQNTGAADTVNLVGTLLATGGITAPSGPQNYGAVLAGGPSVGRSFTFTADPGAICGGTITASLQLQDGAEDLGTFDYAFQVGAVNPIPAAATYSSGNIAVPIPDVSFVEIPISISDVGQVNDVNASVRLNHTFDGDLQLLLIHPDGTAIPLSTNRGGAGDNYGTGANDCSGTPTVFDDAAATAISAGLAPFAGNFRPEQPLSALNGKPVNGIWKLRFTDTANLDTGTIGCVQLHIERLRPVCCGVAGTPIPIASGATIATESCTANGAIDPDETVTVSLGIANAGDAATTNLVATLLPTGGVLAPSAPQNYGAIPADGTIVSRPFTFVASGSCGGTLTATLQLQDGATDLGTVTYDFTLGSATVSQTTFNIIGTITIPAGAPGTTSGPANPFPFTIPVNGVTGTVTKVTLSLIGVNHTFPDDMDVLLVGPQGQKVLLMSDVGGTNDLVNVDIGFDDAAASALPDSALIATGTYRPTNFGAVDTFSAPAPAGPYGSMLSDFNGFDPNGTWNLYIQDDAGGDSGNVNDLVLLRITTSTPLCCSEPCQLTCSNANASNDPGLCNAIVDFTPPGIQGLCGVVSVVPPPGSTFPVGVTQVTALASDAGPTSCNFNVTVTDAEAPVITCPADVVVTADNGSGANVSYLAPTASDNCTANVSCVPPSGNFFPIGVTPVNCTVSDTVQNDSCNFNVNVTAQIGGSIAVDPAGRFVLYTLMGSCSREILVYRALNSSGHPTGPIREITNCGTFSSNVNGIDLLQDSANEYWVSFGGTQLTDPKFLVKIDSAGNILRAPVAAVPAIKFGSAVGATALQKKGNLRLVLWIAGDGGRIYRALIEKSTGILRSVKKTTLLARDAKTMQVTHSGKSFLAIENPLDVLKGFGLTNKPLPDGSSWRLSPRTDGGHGTGGVSSDGRMAFSNDYDPPTSQLFVQPLRTDGYPTGDPIVVVTDDVMSEDVSNTVSEVRYVVFIVTTPTGNRIYLQKIHPWTGQKIGARVLVH